MYHRELLARISSFRRVPKTNTLLLASLLSNIKNLSPWRLTLNLSGISPKFTMLVGFAGSSARRTRRRAFFIFRLSGNLAMTPGATLRSSSLSNNKRGCATSSCAFRLSRFITFSASHSSQIRRMFVLATFRHCEAGSHAYRYSPSLTCLWF